MRVVLLCALVVLGYAGPVPVVPAPSVETDCGTVKGKIEVAVGGTKINTYRNIPYAIPPLGERRWAPSALLSEGTCWEGEHDGTQSEVVQCVNIILSTVFSNGPAGSPVRGVEDCLVLNVRTPDVTGSRPVILWIHGGGLVAGNGEEAGYHQDADYTEAVDVVSVNINYRLNLMGFMTHEDFDSEGNFGNYGFTDQVTALRWVKANIAKFGGDPSQVTIMGESGGGTSILGLVSSPLANNLFNNGIALSPAPFWNTTYADANQLYKTFVSNAGCDGGETKEERRACMTSLPLDGVVAAGFPLINPLVLTGEGYFNFPMRYGAKYEAFGMAVVDPIVVPQAPKDLKDASYTPNSRVKVIISNTAEENGVVTLGPKGINIFKNSTAGWEGLKQTLVDLSANIIGEEKAGPLLDDLWAKQVYPDTSSSNWCPQKAWNVITTDLRGTCPLNNLAVDMAENKDFDIYRLYITHALPGLPSYHTWDTLALFGLKSPSLGNIPSFAQEHIEHFKDAMQALVKQIAYGSEDKQGWATYPTNTKVLTNSAPWSTVVENNEGGQCDFWAAAGLDQYGWQN
uniref:Carboxylic ester hydrolase n=1 Tax=Euplokamis dunlapae TaxID=1403701 RepID=V9PPQ7_9METZ|nr:carboxylesterase domain-containing protein [Euplokamis dunlapae]AHA51352.1 carboxylesterase domain-containing protein [Euplokamis dunlapae]AHA51353.1 carboxylesterase domain-containing protein [Euplokamis dunlapae]AHA51373.1 carboxylesterase domain-containing protein [Euplokamis dunlapae]